MENKTKILIVEDESTLSMIVRDVLEKQEYEVRQAANGNEGLRVFYEFHPDLVVADIMMPQLDGLNMTQQIRQNDSKTPVLFLTAKSKTEDVVKGFETGGSDYLKKPFGMDELLVRIKALLNRNQAREENITSYKRGEYDFDIIHQTLNYHGLAENLSHRETAILERLCKNQNHILDNQAVLLDLWGDDNFFNLRSLHVFIVKLRKKLSKDSGIQILNIRGVGYKLTF
jgi:DNA-binding response OmpR family regulator